MPKSSSASEDMHSISADHPNSSKKMMEVINQKTVFLDFMPKHEQIHPIKENDFVAIGDLHANAVKLLYFLVRQGVVQNMSPEDYNLFNAIYKKTPLTADDIRSVSGIISRLEINPEARKATLCFIGDMFADRGMNDYFTLKIIEKLHSENVPFEILLSNHDLEFIKAYEKHDDFSQSALKSGQAQSSENLEKLIQDGVVSRQDVRGIIDNVYKTHLKALSYSCEHNPVIYSHAPIGIDQLYHMAQALGVSITPGFENDPETLKNTVDAINEAFAKYVQANQVIDLVKLDEFNGNAQDINSQEMPFIFLTWNRVHDLNRPEHIDFIHGHDKIKGKKSSYNLDAKLGKQLLSYRNEVGHTYLYHQPGNYKVLCTKKTPRQQLLSEFSDKEAKENEKKNDPVNIAISALDKTKFYAHGEDSDFNSKWTESLLEELKRMRDSPEWPGFSSDEKKEKVKKAILDKYISAKKNQEERKDGKIVSDIRKIESVLKELKVEEQISRVHVDGKRAGKSQEKQLDFPGTSVSPSSHSASPPPPLPPRDITPKQLEQIKRYLNRAEGKEFLENYTRLGKKDENLDYSVVDIAKKEGGYEVKIHPRNEGDDFFVSLTEDSMQSLIVPSKTDAARKASLLSSIQPSRIEVAEESAVSISEKDINKQDQFGATPLHYAAYNGNENDVKALIKAGANVNLQDNERKFTPLHYAARQGHVEVVKLLLDAGANANIKNKEGKTPRELARESEISKELKSKTTITEQSFESFNRQRTYTPLAPTPQGSEKQRALLDSSVTLDALKEHLKSEENKAKYKINYVKDKNINGKKGIELEMQANEGRVYNAYAHEKKSGSGVTFSVENISEPDDEKKIIENICRLAVKNAPKGAEFSLKNTKPEAKKEMVKYYLNKAAHEFKRPDIVIDHENPTPPEQTPLFRVGKQT